MSKGAHGHYCLEHQSASLVVWGRGRSIPPVKKLNKCSRGCHLRGTALPVFSLSSLECYKGLSHLWMLWPEGLFARMIGKQTPRPPDPRPPAAEGLKIKTFFQCLKLSQNILQNLRHYLAHLRQQKCLPPTDTIVSLPSS